MLAHNRIIAVDFDGTLCENRYPDIGEPNNDIIDRIKKCQMKGDRIILWTCRCDEALDAAVRWCAERHGLIFDAINENIPGVVAAYKSDSRKICADLYIDDRAVNVNDVITKGEI